MLRQFEKASDKLIKQNVNVLSLYVNSDTGDIQMSGDTKWVSAVVSNNYLRTNLINTLKESIVQNGENLEKEVFPLIYPKLTFDVTNIKHVSTDRIRMTLNGLLKVQGFGKNSARRYGEGAAPLGWPADVDWPSFKGASNTKNLCSQDLVRIICSMLMYAGLDPYTHFILETAESTEENGEIFDSYFDYDSSVEGTRFENKVGDILEIKEEMWTIEEDGEEEMNKNEDLENERIQNYIEPSLLETTVKIEKNEEPQIPSELKTHDDSDDGKHFSCKQCDKVYTSVYRLKEHVDTVHATNPLYPCEKCDHKARNKDLLKKHISLIHEGDIFACYQCTKQFTCEKSLRHHKLTVHEGSLFPCDLCDVKFTEKGSLKKHKRAVHDGIRYQCDQCTYKATTIFNLNLHVQRVHETGAESYLCDKCDYKTSHKSYLKSHMDAHHGGVTYSCDQCDFKTIRKQSLQKHIQAKHEGVRYLCDQCDYKASDISSLRKHIKTQHLKKRIDLSLTHNGVIYSCDQCDRQYQLESSLHRHKVSVHEGNKKNHKGRF